MSIEQKYPERHRNGKVIAGLIILVIGGMLLLQQFDWFFLPDGFVGPLIIIAIGGYLGAKNNFTKPVPLILIFIGLVKLADRAMPGIDLSRVIWPVIVIGFGLWLIMGRRKQWNTTNWDQKWGNARFHGGFNTTYETKADPNYDPNAPLADAAAAGMPPPYSSDSYLDTISVFGGTKRTILSKDFKGGEVVNVFGGTDLDLTQADINGRVVIDVTQLFGGIKLIVPPHWQVISDLAAVFSSVDDKRRSVGIPLSADKVLVIKGVSVFAGIDVRSY